MSAVETREIPFHGGTIWMSIHGAHHTAPPLLCVPGGPGLPHDYLGPLAALAAERPVILYDPIGTGRSTRSVLRWSRALLVEELAAVRDQLGTAPIDLYLHSAAILVADDLWSRPELYRRVILASTPFDIPELTAAIQARIDRLPPKLAAALRAGEADPAKRRTTFYGQAYYEFSAANIMRLPSTPPPMQRAALGFNRDILHAVKGGMLLHSAECVQWSIVDRLHQLTMPVLVSCGRHDPYEPDRVDKVTASLPDRQLAVFEASAHMPHLEETAAHLELVARFLR